ncbi:hypothetical protein [Micrococcus sp.]|uniref:hypothetical protein n=1 Tax=Micrococcus sp. TaxID=1271 RepID=UPI002A913EB5|nr:hypothetical protein [Micrococcus sp.]MDY6055124.1 hypothetical protein [Micrococcus sp.]
MASTDPISRPRRFGRRTGTKVWVAAVALLCLFFAGTVVRGAVLLVLSGGVLQVVIGVAGILVSLVGLVLIGRELLFGIQTERLADELAATGGLPVDDLPRSPGGRIDRAAADAQFQRWAEEATAAPEDWRARYRLALAYDASGDRSRARAAAREAVRLRQRTR